MNIITTFLEREEFRKSLNAGIEKFEQIYSKSNFVLNENLYPMQRDSYHFIGQMLKKIKKANRAEEALASQIFNAVYRSEVMSAGAGQIAFLFAIELAKEFSKSNLPVVNEAKLSLELSNYMERLKNNLVAYAQTATPEDVTSTIKRSCEDPILAEVISQAVHIGGLEGKVFVENGRQENYVVEMKEGYTFQLNPFKWMLNGGYWERNECKIIVIDGLVEKVSEIDHLLTKAFEFKQPMVIFAMGFSEEVGMTLRTNLDRGLLDVQPVRIPTDIESINLANDLAVVCGCTPISSMKGDMVVFTKWEDLPTVEKIRISETQTVIENSKTRTAVSDQIRSLLEKRNENYLYEDVQNLLDKRMKSLVSNAVVLFLPEMTTVKNDAQRIQIDIALRQCKTILNYGTVNFKSAVENTTPTNDLEIIIYKALQATNLETDVVPTLSAIMGCALASKAVLMLYNSAGFVSIVE